MMEYAVIRKNVRSNEFVHIYQDLPKIHTIRGRLLNLSTILEHFMKDYLVSKGINKLPKLTIDYKGKNGIFNKFLDEIKKDTQIKKNGIKSFEKHFKFITNQRNNFAHGILYYKNKKQSRPTNINNNIFNKYSQQKKFVDQSLNKKKTIFDKLNKSYEYVFNWLEKNKVLNIIGFDVLKAESQIKMKRVTKN